LDVDLCVLDPATDAINKDYQRETNDLVRAIVAAAAHHHIVLAKTINQNEDGSYRLDPDSYDQYGLCADLDRHGAWIREGRNSMQASSDVAENIHCGYIALTFDRRLIPGALPLQDGGSVESFGFAAARAQSPELVPADGEYFGSFIPKANFDMDTYTATEVLKNAMVKDPRGKLERVGKVLQGKTVIVAGGWHMFAYGRGLVADVHDTPVGPMIGGLIHANFIESLLQHKTAVAIGDWVLEVLVAFLALVAAAVLALMPGFWMKWLVLGGMTVFLVAIQFAMLNILGVFFDGGVVLVGVWLHSIGEWIFEHALPEFGGHQSKKQKSLKNLWRGK